MRADREPVKAEPPDECAGGVKFLDPIVACISYIDIARAIYCHPRWLTKITVFRTKLTPLGQIIAAWAELLNPIVAGVSHVNIA